MNQDAYEIRTMQALPFKWVKDMVKHRPILMLNKARQGISLIDCVVHRNPSFVTSKKDGKAFPLEIWDKIIACALENPKKDEYTLVRPRAALKREEEESRGYVNTRALICDEYKLDDSVEQRNESYHSLLDYPESDHSDDSNGDGVVRPKLTGNTFEVNLDAIRNHKRSAVEVLFVYVGIEDIIFLLEGGRCGFCSGSRDACASGRNPWAEERFCLSPRSAVSVPCPDCIGSPWTTDALSLAVEEDEYLGEDNDEMDKEFEKRWDELYKEVEKREKELGYWR